MQTISVSVTDVTWHAPWPIVTWTLLISVPNELPLMVNTVFGVVNEVGDIDETDGVKVESNVKLQFVLQTASTPFTLVFIWYVPAWSCCVVNVMLL